MRRAFKLSVAVLALALMAWLSFIGWSLYSLLPSGANRASVRFPERVRPDMSVESARDPEAAAFEERDVESPAQTESSAESRPFNESSGCNEATASLRWHITDPLKSPSRLAPHEITSAETLEERAMAGDAHAQYLIGFILQQELLSAAADLESYRADVERNSVAPGIVSEAELRRRFRDLRTRFVTSLQFANRSALPMLVALHRTSLTDEDVVAAAAWDRVGAKLNGTSSEPDSPNASAADIWAGLPASEDLPRSGLRLADPKAQERADNVRRQGVRAGILADQYIMMFELD